LNGTFGNLCRAVVLTISVVRRRIDQSAAIESFQVWQLSVALVCFGGAQPIVLGDLIQRNSTRAHALGSGQLYSYVDT